MPDTMVRKRNPGSRSQSRHTSPRLVFHLPKPLKAAFDAYLTSLPEPRPSDSAALRFALEKLLREKGFWPPSPA